MKYFPSGESLGNSRNVWRCAVAMCMCRNIEALAEQACRSCAVCQKVNGKIIRSQPKGGRDPGMQGFQNVQVDL